MAGGLNSACRSGTFCSRAITNKKNKNQPHSLADVGEVDNLIVASLGEDVIDSLSALEAVVPTLYEEPRHKLPELLPMLNLTLRSRYATIRQSAARR
jgi:hypothetical protein